MRPSGYKKTVLITGCSSGIGKATAHFLKQHGWKVYATARNEADVRDLVQEGFEGVSLDLNSSASIRNVVTWATEREKDGLAAVVHNAGYTLVGAVEDLTREAVRQQFETNVFGPMELTRLLLPVMRKQGHGRVIFMSSVNGICSFPLFGAYCASKYAVEAFADALRRELRKVPIYVTVIEPGLFRTRARERAEEIFCQSIKNDESLYRECYEKYFSNSKEMLKKIPEERVSLVSKAVYAALESERPRTRVMVPLRSIVYELARRFLPDKIQDFLIFQKMKGLGL